jgi:MarR family 2-MHQ and catechol resistance regulon transcriptional repressor
LVAEEASMIKNLPPEVVDGALTLIRQLTAAARARLGS